MRRAVKSLGRRCAIIGTGDALVLSPCRCSMIGSHCQGVRGQVGRRKAVAYGRGFRMRTCRRPPEKLVLKPDSQSRCSRTSTSASGRRNGRRDARQEGRRMFGGGDKKDPREVVLQHLKEGSHRRRFPAADKLFFKPEQLQEMRSSARRQPPQSMFAGVPVFGKRPDRRPAPPRSPTPRSAAVPLVWRHGVSPLA